MKTIGYAVVGTGYFGAELARIMKEQEFESDVFDRGTWQKVFQLL